MNMTIDYDPVIDPISGASFRPCSEWTASIRFVDVQPYCTSTNPVSSLYAGVTVHWGRATACPGDPVHGEGEYRSYSLADQADGSVRSMARRALGLVWVGQTSKHPVGDISDVPGAIKVLAWAALRRQRSARYDGRSYIAR